VPRYALPEGVERLFAVVAAAALVVFAPDALGAQRLFGTVVQADERTPSVGAIVIALDSAGVVVGRDLATGRGDYVLPLTRPGKYTIVARQIGSLDETVRDIDVAAGRDVRTRIVLSRPVRRPAQVTERSKGVCALAGDSTGLAALWDQLQTALASMEMAESSKMFVATWDARERVLDANLRDTLGRSESSERLALDIPFFPTLRPDSSERLGFVVESAEGVRYFVPGPATLRSPGFIARRCFGFEPAPASQPGWIGLHFWPVGYRMGLSEIEGTVWFDATTLEPRALTFLYGGLPPAFAPARPGGGVRFARISTGHWITDEWTLKVPSGRYQRMFAYDARGNPNGYGNLRLDGVRTTTARLAELTVNGSAIVRRP
jgi:hypothetical protein